MTKTSRALAGLALSGAAALALAGCQMDVLSPGVIDATTFDPSGDAATVSLSAQERFWVGYSNLTQWSAYFSDEVWAGTPRLETNDIARRSVNSAALQDLPSFWASIQQGIAANELAIRVLAKSPTAASDINLARPYMNSGFALELLAEHFCQGDILAGPPLTPTQVLDTAIARFKQAVSIGTAAAAAGVAEGTKVVNASNVGMARAYLQEKSYANAAAAAALVPSAFVYNAVTLDDASQRGLANVLYNSGTLSKSVVVPDAYRALNDPRVPWKDAGTKALDGTLEFYQQTKYPSYSTPQRIASGLEASYIAAESKLMGAPSDPSAAQTLIASRRAANGQPAFTGSTQDEILAELMDQRAREFWMEAKHTGDWLRNPTATPYVPPAGSPYYKSSFGEFGNVSCLPVPDAEAQANPNFPKS